MSACLFFCPSVCCTIILLRSRWGILAYLISREVHVLGWWYFVCIHGYSEFGIIWLCYTKKLHSEIEFLWKKNWLISRKFCLSCTIFSLIAGLSSVLPFCIQLVVHSPFVNQTVENHPNIHFLSTWWFGRGYITCITCAALIESTLNRLSIKRIKL